MVVDLLLQFSEVVLQGVELLLRREWLASLLRRLGHGGGRELLLEFVSALQLQGLDSLSTGGLELEQLVC